jgi:hypothetical protein
MPLSAVALALLVSASPSSDVVDAARAVEVELSYERATELWLDVLSDPAIDDATRFEAHVHLGSLYRILGDEGESRSHFRWVLTRDPDFRLPDDAPRKVLGFLELVRDEVKAAAVPVTTSPATSPPAPAPAAPAPASEAPPAVAGPSVPILIGAGVGVVAAVGAAVAAVSFLGEGEA